MSRLGPGRGSRVAIAASVGLMVAALVGVPVYVSSVGSAALAIQTEAECTASLGIGFPANSQIALDRLDAAASEIDHLAEPIASSQAFVQVVATGADTGAARSMVMLARPGQFDELGADVAVPGPGEVLVPEWAVGEGTPFAGGSIDLVDHSRVGSGDRIDVVATLTVAGTYPEIPTRPEPEYWCHYADWLRFSAFGDPPAPLLLVDRTTFDMLPRASWTVAWEVAPELDGLRRDEAADLIGEFEEVTANEREIQEFNRPGEPDLRLETSLRRSNQVADFVSFTIEPLRYAAVVASFVLLAGAGVLAARGQRRELRLRAVRGVSAFGLARTQIVSLVPATLVGALVGGSAAWCLVRALGPSSAIEPASIRVGVVAGTIGWLIATLGVAGVIGVVAANFVDRAQAGHRRAWVRPVLELTVVALAAWSFVRLDEFGGVRQIGVQVRGGDLLAQAFPLLGALAAVVVLARPTGWLLRHARGTGARLRPSLLIGWRRVIAEPTITVAVTMAAALAVSIAFQAGTLTASVDRLLDDKAEMFVGSDLAIMVLGSPPSIDGLGAASTEVVRVRSDDRSVRMLGVDPDTFADVAYWRDDAMSLSLDDAMSQVADGDTVAAILVDPEGVFDEPPTEVSIRNSGRTIEVIATADFFPGYKNGSPMLVVARSVVDDRGDREVWVRDPLPDAELILRDLGGQVTSTFAPSEVFDGTNFLSAKWAYDTLRVFAIVLGVVTLMAQVLVLEARRRSRLAARVLTRPMGATRRDESVALACEVGMPFAFGAVLGAVVGWVIARLALGRLDSLRTLQPPADLVVDPATLVFTAVAVVVVTAVLAVIGGWRADRADPMEVMRVVES